MIGGVLFILAGMFAYVRVDSAYAIVVVLIVAGIIAILVGLTGLRTQGWEIAVFAIGVIVFAAVLGSNYYYGQANSEVAQTYTATSGEINASSIVVSAESSLGSIDIGFSSNSDMGYQVTFRIPSFIFPFFNVESGTPRLTNFTSGRVLYLNASSSAASISITIGERYAAIIHATTSTGSIDLKTPAGSVGNIRNISLSADTGSVRASVDGGNVSSIKLSTNTGSVNLQSNFLSPAGKHIPILVSSNTGSADVNISVANNVAVGINGSTAFGSILHDLPGFSVSENSNGRLVASAGNLSGAQRSFLVGASVNTGSLSIDCFLVSQE